MRLSAQPWSYKGVDVYPVDRPNTSGLRWYARGVGSTGMVRADTKDGMRHLITHAQGGRGRGRLTGRVQRSGLCYERTAGNGYDVYLNGRQIGHVWKPRGKGWYAQTMFGLNTSTDYKGSRDYAARTLIGSSRSRTGSPRVRDPAGWRRHVYEDGSYVHVYDDATFHAVVYHRGPNGWKVEWRTPPPNWPSLIAASSHAPSLARAKQAVETVMRQRRRDPSGTGGRPRTATRLTKRDIEDAYTNPGWSGFGYLHERLSLPRSRRTRADGVVLAYANANGWDTARLFTFLNSRAGRHFADRATYDVPGQTLAGVFAAQYARSW